MSGAAKFLAQHGQAAVVRMDSVRGSSPREEGTWMLVAAGACYGTIGGGQLEYMAIDEARALLAKQGEIKVLDIPLGPEIGQCCGGRVKLTVEQVDDAIRFELIEAELAERQAYPDIYMFGAGHVGRALSEAFALLPVHPIVVDTRAEELALIDDEIDKRLTPVPEDVARNAAPGSAFIILTHDHSLDFLIACEALVRGDAAYVGMIGSKTKRATFDSWCRKSSELKVSPSKLVCPIGVSLNRDKRPEVIAAFVAAEVMAALAPPKNNNMGAEKERREREKTHD
ncbi:MAG: xanthine dehydrogenase accessory protein XdhC [Alphaproteobacteria bacterium]|nr:xanthine dehydrogenase accessory protein XdhC [Alphaproteobacteria bacterium]